MVKANTNRTIKAILQKKYWDGGDAGRILLYDMARGRDQQKKGKEPKPVYPGDEFSDRVNALPIHERLHYRMYEGMAEAIRRLTASYGLYRMSLYYDLLLYQQDVERLQAKDDATRDEAEKPLIMTRKQFERERAQATREHKAATVTYYELVMLEIKDAFRRKDDGVLFDAVLDELEPLRTEKATDEVMLSQYNRLTDHGYYVIPATGLRSDQTDKATWDDAVDAVISKLAARIIKLEMGLRSMPATPTSAITTIARERRYRGMEYLYNGGEAIQIAIRENVMGRKDTDIKGRPLTAEELEYYTAKVIDTLPIQAMYLATPGTKKFESADKHLIEDIANLIIYGGGAPVWHYYDETPEGVNKYDILLNGMELYSTSEGNYFYGSAKGRANAFKTEFPRLYEAALREVERKLGERIDREDITEATARLGTLLKNKHFKELLEPFAEEHKPALLRELERRSVAILDEELAKPEDMDKRGNYKPRTSVYKKWREILRKLEKGEDEDTPRDVMEQYIIPDATRYFAYNQMIDIIAEAADVPLLTVYKSDMDEIEEAAKEVNKKIFNLIYKTYVGTRSEAAMREPFRQQVRDIFKPIKLYAYHATYNETAPILREVEDFIRPPHIYKGGRVLPTATVNHITFGIFQMANKLRETMERRCKNK